MDSVRLVRRTQLSKMSCRVHIVEYLARQARHYRINEACIRRFPSAADVVMGRPAPTPTGGCA